MYNYTTVKKHISQISAGSTIIHNGEMKTVSGNNIKFSEFIGVSLFGDSYNIGNKLVEVVLFKK